MILSPLVALGVQSNFRTVAYEVTTTTYVTLPVTRQIDELRIYQAVPSLRPWHNNGTSFTSLGYSAGAKFENFIDSSAVESKYLKWTIGKEIVQGAKYSFTSTYKTISTPRFFDPRGSKTTWADTKPENTELSPKVKQLADLCRTQQNPALAMLALSVWIQQNIKYDANIDLTDADSVLSARRGHCGHRVSVLKAVAKSLGIQIRNCWGMNLSTPNATSAPLYRTRKDFANVHSWAQIYFPKDGWVEFEPSYGEKAFQIPAQFVQNNGWFQNYVVRSKSQGKDEAHRFEFSNGRWHSDFDVANVINFSTK